MARKEKQANSPLRDARHGKGISIQQMAKAIDYHPSYISSVELGRLKPSDEFLRRYAKCLGLPSDEIANLHRSNRERMELANILSRVGDGLIVEESPRQLSTNEHLNLDTETTVHGSRRVFEAVVGLVDSASKSERDAGEIWITSQGFGATDHDLNPLERRLHAAMRGAIELGWTVHHLWRVTNDRLRTIRFVRHILSLADLMSGYRPKYFEEYGSASLYGLVYVDGIGALLLFATGTSDSANRAIFIRGEAAQVVLAHAQRLERNTKAVMMVYAKEDKDWAIRKSEMDCLPGDRMTVEELLLLLLRPVTEYQEGSPWFNRAATVLGSRELARNLAKTRLRRTQAFHHQLPSYRFWQIASRSRIERWALTGLPSDLLSRFIEPEPVSERTAKIQQAVDLLRKFPDHNFRIAVLDDESEKQLDWVWSPRSAGASLAFTVKGPSSVFIETWRRSGEQAHEVGLAIQEPTVARAFQDYIEDLWRRIPPQSYDRDIVIPWLLNLEMGN